MGDALPVSEVRFGALRTDGVVGILPGGGGLGKDAGGHHVAQVEGLDVIAGQIDIESKDRDRQIAPDRDVGQHSRIGGVVDRDQRRDRIRVVEIHLEVRQQQRRGGRNVEVADGGRRRQGEGHGKKREGAEKDQALHFIPPPEVAPGRTGPGQGFKTAMEKLPTLPFGGRIAGVPDLTPACGQIPHDSRTAPQPGSRGS